jgi:hypothetical protein
MEILGIVAQQYSAIGKRCMKLLHGFLTTYAYVCATVCTYSGKRGGFEAAPGHAVRTEAAKV